MNPERLTVVPDPGHVMEVVSSAVLIYGAEAVHLSRDDRGYTLKVAAGRGMVHLDFAAARQLWRELDANLLLDEARNRLLDGEDIDQITPSTAEFLRDDAAREAAADEERARP